jgi:MFS family permease
VRFTLREPPRGLSEPNVVKAEIPPMGQVLRSLWEKRSFRHLSLAAGLHSFVTYGVGNFYAPFLQRSHHMSLMEAGNALAFIFLIGGAIGTFLGGNFADRLVHRRNDARFLLWVPVVTLLVQFPLSMVLYTISSRSIVLGMLTPYVALSAAYLAPTIAATYTLVGLRERAVASSLLLFMINFIGLGLGPLFSGWLSDTLNHYLLDEGVDAAQAKADGLRWAMRAMVFVNLWSVWHYWRATRTLRQDAPGAIPAVA